MSNIDSGNELEQQLEEYIYRTPTALKRAIDQFLSLIQSQKIDLIGYKRIAETDISKTNEGKATLTRKIALMESKNCPIVKTSLQSTIEVEHVLDLNQTTITVITQIGDKHVATQISKHIGHITPEQLQEQISKTTTEFFIIDEMKEEIHEPETFYLIIDGEGVEVSRRDFFEFFKRMTKEYSALDVEKIMPDTKALKRAIDQFLSMFHNQKIELIGFKRMVEREFAKTNEEKATLPLKMALMGGKTYPIFNTSLQSTIEVEQVLDLNQTTIIVMTHIGDKQVATQISKYIGIITPEQLQALISQTITKYLIFEVAKEELHEPENFYLLIDGESVEVSRLDFVTFFRRMTKEFSELDLGKIIYETNLEIAFNYNNEIDQNIMYFVENERVNIENIFSKKVLKEDEKKFTSALFRILGERHASFGLPNYTKYQISGKPEFEGIIQGEKVAYAVGETDESIIFASIDLKGNRTDYVQLKNPVEKKQS